MSVLVVPSWYSIGRGQVGAFFREQALALQKNGVDVIVADATLKARGASLSNQFRTLCIDDEGLRTYSHTTPSFGGWRFPRLGVMLFRRNLEKIYKKLVADGIKIDLIHAHSYFPAGAAVKQLSEKYGIPYVLTEHSGNVISGNLDAARKKILKQCVDSSAATICVSKALKTKLVELTETNKDIQVIPNMVNTEMFSASVCSTSPFRFISIGNLIQSKRFDLTLRAFASAFSDNMDVALTIVGDGVLRKDLEALTEELGISKQVEFVGRVDRAEVVKQLQRSNAFVLASDFETFGVVYIEALACGLPVIGTKNGGADDIITDDCGRLVDTNDAEQLSCAMGSLYSEYETLDKDRLSVNCRERFGEVAVCKAIQEVYKNICI